jgi:geranylgeranyl pyrophosphate synthase
MQQAKGAAASTLKRIYDKPEPSDRDIRRVMDVMESTGARQEAEALAARLADQTLESIQSAELSPRSIRDFEELVTFLQHRDR